MTHSDFPQNQRMTHTLRPSLFKASKTVFLSRTVYDVIRYLALLLLFGKIRPRQCRMCACLPVCH